MRFCVAALIAIGIAECSLAQGARVTNTVDDVLAGVFQWSVSEPLLAVVQDKLPASPDNPWVAVKDPSIVRFEGRWHLFCSLRKREGGQGRIRIGYLSFAGWEDAPSATWHVLELTDDYHGAPQIFYFEPHRKWYLVYQAADASRDVAYGPCYSTNDDINDPAGWTLPAPLYTVKEGQKAGLDFWVICDETKAYLFFTTLNGRMWRAETALSNFPNKGWADPKVVLQADIFEASHTYKLKGMDKYLSLIEAQNGQRRYYKAYLADRLDGQWKPLAASRERPFAAPPNVINQADSWTHSYSHGELIRTGVDQRLEVDPANLRFIFQGSSDNDRKGKSYGSIPWRLGLLR
ncbi:MAG: non-reducing end alpha-L-arabinofuranosidase family hydrolase [Planctomycetota bacterium]|jgi:hypothetical protein